MKKIIMVIVAMLYGAPSFAGTNCIDNSEHLEKSYDDKEWHSVACDCNCEIIKDGYCTECKHLQNAHPITVISSPKTKKVIAKQLSVQSPQSLDDFFNNRVVPYLQHR